MAYRISRAVIGSTFIQTTNGPVEAAKLVGRPFELSFGGVVQKSSGLVFRGIAPTYRLVTERGYILEGGEDLSIRCEKEFIPLKAVEVGCYVELNKAETTSWGTGSADGLSVLGYLLGRVSAKGFCRGIYDCTTVLVHKKRENPKEAVKHVEEYALSLMGRYSAPTVTHNYSDGSYGVEIPVLDSLTVGFLDMYGTPLPAMETAPSMEIAGFLRGVFDAAGAFHYRGRYFATVTLRDFKTLQVVQRMLFRFGIASDIKLLAEPTLRVSGSNLKRLIYSVLGSPIVPSEMLELLKDSSLWGETYTDRVISLELIDDAETFASDEGLVVDANGFVVLL